MTKRTGKVKSISSKKFKLSKVKEFEQSTNAVQECELFKLIESLDLDSSGLKTGLKDITGHISKDQIFVRSCFGELAKLCLYYGKTHPVCVIGDPGIGKSIYSLYIFMVLVKKKQKVVRVSQGGSFLIFDGKGIKHSSTEYGLDDYWVLLDGKAKETFWDKPDKVIVFASTNDQNYSDEFIKVRSYRQKPY